MGGQIRRGERFLPPFTQPAAPVHLHFSFIPILLALLLSSRHPAGSSLLLSQGQAGLGFPSMSDRSLVTATVSGGHGGKRDAGWDAGRKGAMRKKEDENVHCKNECRDAGSHHATFKQDGHIIHVVVKGVVRHFGRYYSLLS